MTWSPDLAVAEPRRQPVARALARRACGACGLTQGRGRRPCAARPPAPSTPRRLRRRAREPLAWRASSSPRSRPAGRGPSLVHVSAAALDELLPWDGRTIEVTAPSRHRLPRHHRASIRADRAHLREGDPGHAAAPHGDRPRAGRRRRRRSNAPCARRSSPRANSSGSPATSSTSAPSRRRARSRMRRTTSSSRQVCRHPRSIRPTAFRPARSIPTCAGRRCGSSSRSTAANGTTIRWRVSTTRNARPSSKPAVSACSG